MNAANDNQPLLTDVATVSGEDALERVRTEILVDSIEGDVDIPAYQAEMAIANFRLAELRPPLPAPRRVANLRLV